MVEEFLMLPSNPYLTSASPSSLALWKLLRGRYLVYLGPPNPSTQTGDWPCEVLAKYLWNIC